MDFSVNISDIFLRPKKTTSSQSAFSMRKTYLLESKVEKKDSVDTSY